MLPSGDDRAWSFTLMMPDGMQSSFTPNPVAEWEKVRAPSFIQVGHQRLEVDGEWRSVTGSWVVRVKDGRVYWAFWSLMDRDHLERGWCRAKTHSLRRFLRSMDMLGPARAQGRLPE